jgi:tetratricopeptide (TPR) repeat protein
MRTVVILLLSAFALSSPALAESPKDWADCASNEPDRSIAGCDKIIARAKDTKANLAIAYSNRGNDYQSKGEHDKAIADYTQSIKLNPAEPGPRRNRGWSHGQKHEFDLALDDYNQTLKLKASYPGIYYDLGWTYAAKKDHARALNFYNRAIELDKTNPNIYNDRGSPSLAISTRRWPISTSRLL